ncbi:MAG: exo-alpha-sialidase [Planctomycetota bacterium]|nr:MAG: exo-alpha-sialidase [Planctomycetota bacterium]
MTLQINRRQWIQSLGACMFTVSGKRLQAQTPEGYTIPTLDIDGWLDHQVIVDREPGQYLGHPTTVLLEDGKTILTVYPKGHGKGPIQYKKSTDAGKSWSERLPTPPNWVTSGETPTIHRVVDANGKKRLILFSGLKPIRMAVSEDDGAHWTELKPIADYGGIVPMGSVVALKDKPGHYLALFHDDGRFMNEPYRPSPKGFYVYQINSADGGLTWSEPKVVAHHPDAHLCEPGAARSPDGKQIAVLLRENSRKHNSFLITSEDEGQTWSKPKELPAALTGDRHTAAYARDGRLLISFRDTTRKSPTKGDWVAWVGRYEDIIAGREGEYRVRIKKNHKSADCAYPGVEILADDTFVLTTYGHWTPLEQPYILSVRVRLDELDQLKSRQK